MFIAEVAAALAWSRKAEGKISTGDEARMEGAYTLWQRIAFNRLWTGLQRRSALIERPARSYIPLVPAHTP